MQTPAPSRGPLDGLQVLELGQLIAGPFCGQILGDFGADVIKLEQPGLGDPMRDWGREKPRGQSLWWPIVARNKRSITCNLREPAGQHLVRRLARQSDVLIENFRPGTLERWNLGPDVLAAENPRLVITRVTGFGQDGPYAERAGFGAIGEAMGGLRYVMGEPGRNPVRAGISIGDALASVFAALGTLAALQERTRSHQGQVVDTAIYEAVLALMESLIPEWVLAGYQREPSGAVLPNVAPSNLYPTGDGTLILLAANQDTVFRRLADAMGTPGLASDERFASHGARGRNMEALDTIISEWTATLPSEQLLAVLHKNAVPASKIYRASDMVEDEHFAARDAIVRIPHPVLGEVPQQNVFPRLSRTPGTIRSTGPALGEHNHEVYGDLLGLSEEEIDALRAEKVI